MGAAVVRSLGADKSSSDGSERYAGLCLLPTIIVVLFPSLGNF